jgi:hypothetical protein
MTSQFILSEMTPKERAQHGAALAKGVAFDAVYALYRRRKSEGWTNTQIASNVGVDEGWLSKQFVGPRNATINSVGTIVEGLDGILEIRAYATEDVCSERTNYNAYAEFEEPVEQIKKMEQVPPQFKGAVTGYQEDPGVSQILKDILGQKEAARVPVI